MNTNQQTPVVTFEQVISRGCGLDVHEKTVVATIDGQGLRRETRTYDTFTESLIELRNWLKEQQVTHIAMESTGVYWKPIFNILEEGFSILLVNARHLKNVPGRKTDKADSEWICKLLLSGLLKGSFVPAEKLRNLRDLSRYATKLTQQASGEKNRIHKILEDANIKLSSVVSDIDGAVSGRLIAGLIAGRTDLSQLIEETYHKRLKASKADLLKAIRGKLTDHHRFMLGQIQSHLEYLEKQVIAIEHQMDQLLQDHDQEVELLKDIPGVDDKAAKKVLSEIGTDMEVFPSEKHLSKWAGICPGNNETAGKKKADEPRRETNT
jgi:transposase